LLTIGRTLIVITVEPGIAKSVWLEERPEPPAEPTSLSVQAVVLDFEDIPA